MSALLYGSPPVIIPVTSDCDITVRFGDQTFTVTASGGTGGTVTPTTQQVVYNTPATVTVTPNVGYTATVTATGCTGTLSDTTYVTEPLTANCTVKATFKEGPLCVNRGRFTAKHV